MENLAVESEGTEEMRVVVEVVVTAVPLVKEETQGMMVVEGIEVTMCHLVMEEIGVGKVVVEVVVAMAHFVMAETGVKAVVEVLVMGRIEKEGIVATVGTVAIVGTVATAATATVNTVVFLVVPEISKGTKLVERFADCDTKDSLDVQTVGFGYRLRVIYQQLVIDLDYMI